MIRSGSTWQYNIVKEILSRKRQVTSIGFLSKEEELIPILQTQDNFIVKFHFASMAVISDVQRGTGKAFYIHRQLEDIAVSYMKMKQKDLPWVLDSNLLRNAWKTYKIWTAHPEVLVQRYEDSVKEPLKTIRQIAQYLEISLTDEEITYIEKKYNIESQKKFIAGMPGSSPREKLIRKYRRKIGGIAYHVIGKQRTRRLASVFRKLRNETIDQNRLLHNEHINTGEVDFWKKALNRKDQEHLSAYLRKLTSG